LFHVLLARELVDRLYIRNQGHCFVIDAGNPKMPPNNKRITQKVSMDINNNF
jgi:hypothetical protein